jgi:NhaP-type Na+/H+ or K+/H+ antiporter
MPMVFLGLGVAAFTLLPDLPTPDPLVHGTATERLTEITVIIALFGAGLALDRPVGWRRWASTWRLLGLAMPLTILAVGALGGAVLGLGLASALLLGSALAPTDPVLASDVQVGEPTDAEDSEDEPRFALTSEAGLNDALAFPFVHAAIAIAVAGAAPAAWLGHWVALDVLWRLTAGVVVGLAVGRGLGWLFFNDRPRGGRLAERSEGFVALACTFAAYGVTEVVQGYGFIAVFVCACAVRSAERSHGYHGVMHGFIEQIERLLTAGVLVLLGGSIARGLLDPLTPRDIAVAAAAIVVVRPVIGWLSLLGGRRGRADRWVIAFFGVRGIGSIYYVAYALGHARFPDAERLWAVTGLVILGSVVVHGVAATPVMHRIDRARHRRASAVGREDDAQQVPV